MRPDHYATLGVLPGATAAEIRAAYIGLMRQYHPDHNRNPDAGERAQSIIAAFKILSDFDRRSHYDWDRRRDRERVAAAAVVAPDRTLDKKAAVVGAGGAAAVVAAMVGWSLVMPVEPKAEPQAIVATAPELAVPNDQLQEGKPVRAKGERMVIRMRPALPTHVAPTIVERQDMPKPAPPARVREKKPALMKSAERLPVEIKPKVRVAKAEPEPIRIATLRPPKPSPVVRAATKPAPHSREPTTNLADLDQFVMAFYGQSWRFGDARRRAALEQSRSAFVVRKAMCAADTCRRAAYLKLQRDVSAIVESGRAAN